jgi:hypothetical protein
MGAWGVGSFENDTACDWTYGLDEVEDLSLVRETLAAALDCGEDYLDADLACEALAACEVLARLKGNWGLRDSFSETVDRWVESHPMEVPADLVDTALYAIDRTLTPPSELLELWEEGAEAGEWRKDVEDLRSRVRA